MSDFRKAIYDSKVPFVYLKAFGIFAAPIFLVTFIVPLIRISILESLALIGFMSGCFLGFGCVFQKLFRSLLLLVVFGLVMVTVVFLAVNYLDGQKTNIFQSRDLNFELKLAMLLAGVIFAPPVFGYWLIVFGNRFLRRR